ncbi:MAG: hypothetical protein Q8L64_00570 [bacterium]|nr:hypothetical protein [bacterium]
MNFHLARREKLGLLFLSVLALAGIYFGWRLFWFLTDDAFISFRYISNSILGYGYVWNPAPFRPVEGYTSFLWVVFLDGVWRLFGVEPPDSANVISLVLSCLTLIVGALMVLRMELHGVLKRYRVFLLGLVFLGTLTNRTFLAWTSSGLETALFNLLFTLFIYCVLFLKVYKREWIWGIAIPTTLISLTRPDGILFAVAAVFLIGAAFYKKMVIKELAILDFMAAMPLLIIPFYFIWRYLMYGAWLPNTYFAKVTGRIWLESGVRYFLSFVIEYSLWIWLLLLFTVIVFRLIQSRFRLSTLLALNVGVPQFVLNPDRRITELAQGGKKTLKLGWLFGIIALSGMISWLTGHPFWAICLLGVLAICILLLGILDLSLTQFVVIFLILVHLFYYTVIVGGDHFEFRVYSHLILLLFISFIWLLNAIKLSIKTSVFFLMILIFCSLPIPWTHWVITHKKITRQESVFLKASVTDAIQRKMSFLPEFAFQYLRAYDDMQFWLIDHAVCMRHQEHKVFYLYLVDTLPSRTQGLQISGDGFPVMVASSVGVISWVLPHVNIIDGFGLNDYVIARNMELSSIQYMAHSRRPPKGYAECFSPNVTIDSKTMIVTPRSVELTAEKITACEKYYETVVSGH